MVRSRTINRSILLTAAVATFAGFSALSAQAAIVTWNGSSSTTWSTPGNWTGGAPGAADTAEFTNASPTNQPTVTASTSITGMTLTVNPQITINNGFTLTVTGSATGSAGITLKGAGLLSYTATGSNLSFGTGDITLDGGGFGVGTEIAINTTTGLPTGGGGADRTLLNNIVVTANGGRLNMNSGSGSNGLAVAFNTITLGGALTMGSGGGGNADGYTIAGTVTLMQDSTRTLRITNNTGHNGSDWIAGKITDGAGIAGNALRIAITGKTLQIANGANDYAGGTIIEAGTTSSYVDVTAGATLGTGNLTVQSGGRIRLGNPTVLASAGNLAINRTIAADAGSAVGVNASTNIADRFTNTSLGVYGIEGSRNYALDMSTLGSGRMFLGSVTGGTYSGTSLTAGLDNTYRLGGGSQNGNFTNLVLTGTNALTGNNKLFVGSGLNTNASYGRTLIGAAQNFVGNITVSTDGFLITQINGSTPFGNTSNTIDVYGTLAATGLNGVFNVAYAPNITLRPGSSLIFDNQNFGNATGNNNTNRWDDSTALPTLNGATFMLTSARTTTADSTETVGAVIFNGNSAITFNGASSGGHLAQLTIASLTRNSNGVLFLTAQGTLGATGNGNSRLIQTAAPTPVNGMVAPWMIRSTAEFLNYTTEYTSAAFTSTNLNTALSTDIVNVGATALTTNPTVYALKATGAITGSGGNTTITIGSGSTPAGLIVTANGATHTAIFDFGSREAIIWKTGGNPDVFGNTTSGGIKTTGGLTKAGSNQISLAGKDATNQSISGGVIIQAGQLNINTAYAATDMADNLLTVNHAGTFNLADNNVTVAGLAGVGPGGNVTNSTANLRTLTISLASGTRTYEGRLQGTNTASSFALTKTGAGKQILTGVGRYTGATTINQGELQVDGSLAATAVAVNNTGTLSGSGSIAGSVTINSGGTHAPGNSPGTQNVASEVWNGGGNYAWDIVAAAGTPGTQWDLINASGALTLNNTSGNKFNINVTTVGSVTGFNTGNNYSWLILDSGTSISGFDANAFAINVDSLTNFGGASLSNFNIARGDTVGGGDNTQLYLTYSGAAGIPSVSLTNGPLHANLATGGYVSIVVNPTTIIESEIDDLTSDLAVGSAQIGSTPNVPPANMTDVYVMMWITGAGDLDGLVAALETIGDGSGYLISDNDLGDDDTAALATKWSELQNQYAGFNTLIRFNGPVTFTDFNWDFGSYTGLTLDKLAVVPEPASLALLALGGVALLTRRRK